VRIPQDDLLVTASEIDLVAERYELEAEAGDVVSVDGPHFGFLTNDGARQYSERIVDWLDNCVY
jgi:hypothetical protein